MNRLFLSLVLALQGAALLVGCGSEAPTPVVEPTPPPSVEAVLDAPQGEHAPIATVDPLGVDVDDPFHAELDGSPTRPRRRMDIDQLNDSLRTVMGGIAWTERQGAVDVDLFEQLSASLGRPDYMTSTEENLEITPIFEKFLSDAANMTCNARAARDRDAYLASDRVLLARIGPADTSATAPDAVDENLRHLLLRFHGRTVAAGAPELASWRWLFDEATAASSDPVEGWRTVCVALVTHTDFYTY